MWKLPILFSIFILAIGSIVLSTNVSNIEPWKLIKENTVAESSIAKILCNQFKGKPILNVISAHAFSEYGTGDYKRQYEITNTILSNVYKYHLSSVTIVNAIKLNVPSFELHYGNILMIYNGVRDVR